MNAPASICLRRGRGYAWGLKDWLDWQEQLHAQAVDLGLHRCHAVASRMGLLNPSHLVISVAGTNGKGSSVAMLEAILELAGYCTGTYTSPHLVRYNERIRLAGEPLMDADLCRAFAKVEQARGDISLTYFEFGTLAALELFREAAVDVALLEVGLGGRLDAVNILDADLALISSISMDHQDWLGSDRNAIGREKAGICRRGVAAVCADPVPPVGLLARVSELQAPLFIADRDFHLVAEESSWSWSCPDRAYTALSLPHPYSRCQLRNAAGVLMVLRQIEEKLPVSEQAIRGGLQQFQLKGRFQLIPGTPSWILDVAHNEQAAKELCRSLDKLDNKGDLHVVVGMLKDKDHQAVLAPLFEHAASWHVVDIPGERGCSAAVLADLIRQWGENVCIKSYDNIVDVIDTLQHQAASIGQVLVTGSFVTVGSALAVLEQRD